MFRKKNYILIVIMFLLTGCVSLLSEEAKNYNRERAMDDKARGIDVDTWSTLRPIVINHTKQEIVKAEIDGTSTRSSGIVELPNKWHSGLTVKVSWAVDPNPEAFNFKIGLGEEERKAYKTYISKYQHHEAVVSVPPYTSNDLCTVSAHIFPDNKVRVAVSCNYDIYTGGGTGIQVIG